MERIGQLAVFCSILFKINVTQNMPKLAKSVQIRYKVSKYVTNVWQWRTPAGDMSAQQGVDTRGIQSTKVLVLEWGL